MRLIYNFSSQARPSAVRLRCLGQLGTAQCLGQSGVSSNQMSRAVQCLEQSSSPVSGAARCPVPPGVWTACGPVMAVRRLALWQSGAALRSVWPVSDCVTGRQTGRQNRRCGSAAPRTRHEAREDAVRRGSMVVGFADGFIRMDDSELSCSVRVVHTFSC